MDPVFRPMRADDVAAAQVLTGEAFGTPRGPRRAPEWERRILHLIGTDPGGCWVVESDGELIGCAVSFIRDTTWILASYAVREDWTGRGVGRALLAPALDHGSGCLRAMLASSTDPRAVRRYHAAGFEVHPQLTLAGTVDRSALPAITKVRQGSPADRDLMDSLDRRVRDAAHGPDHELMSSMWRLLVSDTTTGAGYAYTRADRGAILLAADNRRTAERLLWAALADTEGEISLRHVTSANQWAIGIGIRAGLRVGTEGYLMVRGMKPPAPYIHSGALL